MTEKLWDLGFPFGESQYVVMRSQAEQHTEARTKWLYGQWLISEAHYYNLPVLEPRPWTTLVERIIAASHAPI